jgi:hypothetical protein
MGSPSEVGLVVSWESTGQAMVWYEARPRFLEAGRGGGATDVSQKFNDTPDVIGQFGCLSLRAWFAKSTF